MEQEIKKKLEQFPLFRERHLRADYLTILALRKEHLEQKYKVEVLSLKEMARFGKTYSSYDRIWRLVLKTHKELRGNDYGEEDETKNILEQEAQMKFGYEANYHSDLKKLAKL